jgi:hypothetical protein
MVAYGPAGVIRAREKKGRQKEEDRTAYAWVS